MSGFGTQEQYFSSSSSSSSSSTTSQYTYDVFLSFRGQDTRKTFTDHLYTALVQAGLRTFRDDEAIAVGENIKIELRKAIQESRVSIVVLSKDYASSSWCLDELVMILKRKRASGHVVLPVFYEVDLFQVRKRFARHEERFKEEVGKRKIDWVDKVNEWRAALDEIADLGRMVLKDQAVG